MKNLILNLLTFIAFGVFFLLATATSEDECFYNMEVERTATGLAVTNNNDFNYTNLELIISKTVINDSDATPLVIDTTFIYELKGQDIGIDVTREFPFMDFRASDNSFPSDTILNFSLNINGTAPEEDFCFFSEFF